ncbi:hypothetical protein WN944_015449 [Citrus x changshan-huyou]|uniref:Uncharacterized protein n=1 Tax=Citrus x changshan-huyou TaxID=2935761 RepID=A0AAP0M931_9ROSI
MNLAERKRVERTSDGAWISVQGKNIIEVGGITLKGNNRINDHKDNKKLDKGKVLAFPLWRNRFGFSFGDYDSHLIAIITTETNVDRQTRFSFDLPSK